MTDIKGRNDCQGCPYYKISNPCGFYGSHNECSLLEQEYFRPDGCEFVNEDGSVNKEELEKYYKEIYEYKEGEF